MIVELHNCEDKSGNKVSINDLVGLVENLGFHQVANQRQVFVFER